MEEDFSKTKAELDIKEDLLANKLAEVGLEIKKQGKKKSDAKLDLVKEDKDRAEMPITKEVKEKKPVQKKAKLAEKDTKKTTKIKPNLVKEDKQQRVEPINVTKKIEPSKQENKHTQNKPQRGDILKLEKGLKGFDVEMGLKYCMNDVVFYEDMLNTYVENEKIGDLLTYIQVENWDAFLLTLRSVRNTSQTIGAMELTRSAKDLELAFKRGDLDYIKSNARAFLSLYRSTIEVIKGYREEA